MKKNAILLLFVLLSSSALLILVNYYTIRILSASRAYINGESQYSKGQKDAAAHLISFLYKQNNADYLLFTQRISVPIGDHIARITMVANGDHDLAAKGFLQGKNHPSDVDGLIWLFYCFKNLTEFKQVVHTWSEGDVLVAELNQLGATAWKASQSGNLSTAERDSLVMKVDRVSVLLTVKEEEFSNKLGAICREVNVYIFIANCFFTLLILGSALLYAGMMIKRLANSKRLIFEQNAMLNVTNVELDKLLYNVSHDLRSPLASLSGLINLMEHETDLDEIMTYTRMMKLSINKQNEFINDILNSIKKAQDTTTRQLCDFTELVEDVITQNHFIENGGEVHFKTELEITRFHGDALKLKIVLNNLVSNAIKYADFTKPEVWVKIKTHHLQNNCVIEVEDNGIGIKNDDQRRIFEKYFMSAKNNKASTGLGLYLVNEAVKQMNGTIQVNSEPGTGSKFIINIPIM